MRFWRGAPRRRSPFNNLGPHGLTCGRVTSHLYVGGELGPRDWKALEQEGVTVAINLQQEQQDLFAANEQVDGYLWLPSPDGLAPSLAQLETGVQFIHAAVEADKRVFVHCKAGQGRAPLLCACYLIRTQGLKPLEAIGRVREARTRTQLTPEQSVRLREYAAAFGAQPDARQEAQQLKAQQPQRAAPHDDHAASPASQNGMSQCEEQHEERHAAERAREAQPADGTAPQRSGDAMRW